MQLRLFLSTRKKKKKTKKKINFQSEHWAVENDGSTLGWTLRRSLTCQRTCSEINEQKIDLPTECFQEFNFVDRQICFSRLLKRFPNASRNGSISKIDGKSSARSDFLSLSDLKLVQWEKKKNFFRVFPDDIIQFFLLVLVLFRSIIKWRISWCSVFLETIRLASLVLFRINCCKEEKIFKVNQTFRLEFN